MYYYLYKTTNLLNGMSYIGAHRSKQKDDEYYGSGKYLRRAIAKYGKENFEKEILDYYDTEEEMYLAEREIVNENFFRSKHTYNMKLGGEGGWPSSNSPESLAIGKKVKLWWDNLSTEERELQKDKVKIATSKAMNNPIMRQTIKDGLANRPKEIKERQYKNISQGIKSSHASKTDEEKKEFRRLKKIAMSKPKARKNISIAMRAINQTGYNNPDFKGRWGNRYEMIKDDVIQLMNTDMLDTHIYLYIKEKYQFGYKLDRLLKYYEYKQYITEINKTKINGKNKTYCEDIR